jgi:hypothetical protein
MPGSHSGADVDLAQGSPQGPDHERETYAGNDDLQSLQEQLAEFEEENAVLSMENQMLEAFYESVAHEIGDELRKQSELHSNDGVAGKKKAAKKEKKDEGLQTLTIEQKQRCARGVFDSHSKGLDQTRAERERVRFYRFVLHFSVLQLHIFSLSFELKYLVFKTRVMIDRLFSGHR